MSRKELQPECLCGLPEADGYACPVHDAARAGGVAAHGAGPDALAGDEPARPVPPHPIQLTHEELVNLTALRRPSAQIRWLLRNGWTFHVRADGRPAVARAEYEAQTCSGRRRDATRLGPDLAALDRLG